MWKVDGHDIEMCEGDFGYELPFEFKDTTVTDSDFFRIVIKRAKNTEPILTKEYSSIADNKLSFALTEEESARFPVGSYFYSLDWYQSSVFMCNLVPTALFKVVDKV